MTDRWTAETEELVTDTLMQGYGRLIGRPGITHETGRLLTALADAGALLPPGGETRQDVGHWSPKRGYVWPCTGSVEDHSNPDYACVCPISHTAGVTTWPDGSRHTGPWVAVNET